MLSLMSAVEGKRPLSPMCRALIVLTAVSGSGCYTEDPRELRRPADTVFVGDVADLPRMNGRRVTRGTAIPLDFFTTWAFDAGLDEILVSGVSPDGTPTTAVLDPVGRHDPITFSTDVPAVWITATERGALLRLMDGRELLVERGGREWTTTGVSEARDPGRIHALLDSSRVIESLESVPADAERGEIRLLRTVRSRALADGRLDTLARVASRPILWSRSAVLPVILAPDLVLDAVGPSLVYGIGDSPSFYMSDLRLSPTLSVQWEREHAPPGHDELQRWLRWARRADSLGAYVLPPDIRMYSSGRAYTELLATSPEIVWVKLGIWSRGQPLAEDGVPSVWLRVDIGSREAMVLELPRSAHLAGVDEDSEEISVFEYFDGQYYLTTWTYDSGHGDSQ